jgi:hypothetical protein
MKLRLPNELALFAYCRKELQIEANVVVEYAKEYWRLELAHNCWNRGFGSSLNRRSPDMARDLEMVSKRTTSSVLWQCMNIKYSNYYN